MNVSTSIIDSRKKTGVAASNKGKSRVSFATEVEERTIPMNQSSLQQNSHPSLKRLSNDETNNPSYYDDDEYDDVEADPATSYVGKYEDDGDNGVGETWEERKQARNAKTQRALRRISNQDVTLKEEDIESQRVVPRQKQQQQQHRSIRSSSDSFLGEEDTDRNVSLFFDHDRDSFRDQNLCPIEPFNLKSEREDGDGYFEGDTYIFRRKRTPNNNDDDAWLQQMENEESVTASNSTSAGGSIQRKSSSSSSNTKGLAIQDRLRQEKDDQMSKEEVYNEISSFMARNHETVLQAISRYGNIMKSEKKRKRVVGTDDLTMGDSTWTTANAALNRLTELTNICLIKFDDVKIFERTKGSLRQGNENDVGNTTVEFQATAKVQSKYFDSESPPHDESHIGENMMKQSEEIKSHVKWEYKGNEDGKIHGPFTTEQMLGWIQAGYFVGESTVDVRIFTDTTLNPMNSNNKTNNVQDLLGDLDDFDDENVSSFVEEKSLTDNTGGEWTRSDRVNFTAFL